MSVYVLFQQFQGQQRRQGECSGHGRLGPQAMCVEGLEEGDLDGKHNGSTLKNTGSRIRMWPLQQLLLQEQSGHHFHFVPLGDLAQEKVQGNNYCFISQTRIVWREDNLINSRQFFSAHFMLQLQLADRLPCCNGPWDSPLHRPALTVLVKVHIGTY